MTNYELVNRIHSGPTQRQRGTREKKLSSPATVCMVFLFCAVAVISSSAQSPIFTTLVNFDGANGAQPAYMSFVQGTGGDLYGTTQGGGASDFGTVFKITASGTLTVLYSFCSQSRCTDGDEPWAGLVLGSMSTGNFYGTTTYGGGNFWYGTVFEITPAGALTTLYSFCSQPDCPDGYYPSGGLVQGSDGLLYGTTYGGGSSSNCMGGCGTVFNIFPVYPYTLTTLHSFNGTDGQLPAATLVQGSDGSFYGTTLEGGAYGMGTVFKIDSTGALTTLYSFCGQPNCVDGATPIAGLVQAADGNFYGTTRNGGINECGSSGCGTVFKMTPAGALTTLHSFDGTDGQSPTATLIQASDGNFYGTAQGGGAYGHGTVFKIASTGTLTTLHSFSSADGSQPAGAMMQAANGWFYGTTNSGGPWTWGYGTVFRLDLVRTCATCRP